MSAAKIVDRPAQYPGHTVWGEVGRCAYLGELIRGTDQFQGVSVYVSEREFNELRAAFGYPTRDQVATLEQELACARDRIDQLEADLVAHREPIRVVPVDEIVPYVKKTPGRPRATAEA